MLTGTLERSNAETWPAPFIDNAFHLFCLHINVSCKLHMSASLMLRDTLFRYHGDIIAAM